MLVGSWKRRGMIPSFQSENAKLRSSSVRAVRLEPTVTAIGQALVAAPIAHADETGMRVAGKLHWLHVLATPSLTWMDIHPNRGNKAFDAFGLARRPLSAPWYTTAGSPTASWPATTLLVQCPSPARKLTYVFEEMGQCWAKRLIEMRVEACQEVTAAGGPLAPERIALFRSLCLESIAEGEAANPRAQARSAARAQASGRARDRMPVGRP